MSDSKNLLMFSIDDLNAFATLKSLYPGVVHTPNIDRLMDMGTTFSSAYSQAPLCNPSRTSVLSGQLPTTTQVFDNSTNWYDAVSPDNTIFKIVKDAGYTTVGAGKLFHTMPDGLSDVLFDSYFKTHYQVPYESTIPLFGIAPFTGDPDTLGDVQSSKVISEFLSGYDSPQPFFASLGLNKPHAPWLVPQEYFDLYPLDRIALPHHLDSDASDISDFARAWMRPELQEIVVERGLWTKALQGYFAAISYMDAQIGRVLDALEASGHADNTVIALWSDHGYHLGDKDVWHKFTLWDEAGRAPLIIADPAIGRGGDVVTTTVSLVDVMPTLLDALGIDGPAGLDGRSLVPLIRNPSLDWDDGALTFVYGSWSYRTDEFRYIRYADGSEELYDMAADPHQWTNVAHQPAYLQVKRGLLEQAVDRLAAQGWIQGTDSNAAFLNGNRADNYLSSPSEDVVLRGGMGDDWYFVWSVGQTVREAIDAGTDTIMVAGDYTMPLNVEVMMPYAVKVIRDFRLNGNEQDNTILGLAGKETMFGLDGDDVLRGGQGDDTLWGGNGDDWLAGQANADTLHGGAGDDTYGVDNAGDRVTEAAGEGRDRVESSISYTLGVNVEDLTLTGAAAINGTGNAARNSIAGNSNKNLIDGGAGADLMSGDAGNDIYIVDDMGDIVVESADGGGADRVQSSVGYTLTDNVEHLTLTGSADINATGNSAANTITGNSGNNLIDGGAGNDHMYGGAGNDTYVAATINDRVYENPDQGIDLVQSSVSHILSANVENLTLTGSGNANAIGNGEANVLTGNTGDNHIDGGANRDTMAGGAGDDSYMVDDSADIVTERPDQGIDTVISSVNRTLSDNIENLTLTGTAAGGTGNALDNIITGNRADNILDGGGGHDTIIGGRGDDRLAGANGDDILRGGSEDDMLFGGTGDDRLDGGPGDDAMFGGAGDDVYYVDSALDAIAEAIGFGIDTVHSIVTHTLAINVENLVLDSGGIGGTGNILDNSITGSGGNNAIDGGAGNDTLTGGIGSDTFVFSSRLNAATNVDLIVDFSVTHDSFNLKQSIFAGLSAGTLDADAFVIGAFADDASARIVYNRAAGQLFYDADGNGAGGQIRFAAVTAGTALTHYDFIVS